MSLKTMDVFHAIPDPSLDTKTPQTPHTPHTLHTLHTPISPPPTSPPHSPLPRLPSIPDLHSQRPRPPRPVRKSSEGPEVVQEYLDRKNGLGNGHAFVLDGERFKRQRVGNGTLSQKQIDPDQVETKRWPSPVIPAERRSFVPFLNSSKEGKDGRERKRRKYGICGMMVVGLVAFLVGGGIGGGVGGALVAKEKAKSGVATETPTLAPTATATLTSSSSPTATMILDYAGCPLINNKNYTSSSIPNKTYRQFCASDAISSTDQTINMGNITTSTLGECLDKCSAMNGCMAATWVVFSPSSPGSNSVCFFKSEVGVVRRVNEGTLAVGVLL